MVPVNGKPIIFKQIENLKNNGITDITIVSGYKGNILKERVRDLYPNINIIESVDYASTNNMYSAYLAKNYLKNSDFLMMNADVFYDNSVIAALLKFNSPNAIVTDIGNYLDESMKVVERDGRLVKISKDIKECEALGSSIDVYKFSSSGGSAFFKKCSEYIEVKKEIKLWSEVALNDVLSEVEFKPCPLVGRWLEIDNHEDLASAEKLFSENK